MSLLELYRTTDPWSSALWLCAGFAISCWALSVLTREYSWVDRVWSIAPAFYALHFAAFVGFDSPRLNLMAALVLFWGVRLTYNFARKGGYQPGGEDYRWAEIKARIGPVGFQALNATFIAPLQNLLLLLLVAPSYLAYRSAGTALDALDYAAAASFVLALVGETVADEQQWRFHTVKHAARARGEEPKAEFLTTGLFRFSRHPNFFFEQLIWWSFYLFSVASGGAWLNWTIIGAAALTVLFQASTWLTEQITARKYPEYAHYQQTTSRLIPWFPGSSR